MIIKDAALETVCGITSKLPDNAFPEIALAGKSNVGKSSLINNLVCRKALARTSSEPGKTQTINYYLINKGFYLVDLPGYGFAKVSQETRAKWGRMIENYLNTSKQLAAVILLLDIRHAPSENDKIMYDWIVQSGFKPILVATKLDKLKRSEVSKALKVIKESLNLDTASEILKYSAKNGDGREELLDLIEKTITPD